MENIREIIENSDSLALILNGCFDEHKTLAREAMRIAFQDKENPLYLFPKTPENLIKKWSDFITPHVNPELLNKSSIRLPKSRFNIKEIGYEEDDDFFILNIHSQNDKIEKNDIHIESSPSIIDHALSFDHSTSDTIILPEKDFLIKNKRFFINQNNKTLSEETFNIIQSIEPEKPLAETDIPTLLLASLLIETNNLRGKWVDENLLNFTTRLMKLGADKKIINEKIKEDQSISFSQLLGRALARTYINESLKSVWTFISEQDIQKTEIKNPTVSFLSKISNEIPPLVPSQPLFVLIWQKQTEVWAMLTPAENKKELITKLSSKINSSEIKDNFITSGPYGSFSEAEIKIQRALKEILL